MDPDEIDEATDHLGFDLQQSFCISIVRLEQCQICHSFDFCFFFFFNGAKSVVSHLRGIDLVSSILELHAWSRVEILRNPGDGTARSRSVDITSK